MKQPAMTAVKGVDGQIREKRGQILRDFAETTSAHGCILVSKSTSAYARAVWTTATLAAWTICLIQILIAIDKYYQYHTIVSVQIRHLSSIAFPAVTICNLNPIKASWLREHLHGNMMDEFRTSKLIMNFTEHQWKEFEKKQKVAEHITPEMRIVHKHLRLIYEKNVNLSVAGHELAEMLIDCTFQSAKCTKKNFTRWEHGMYGNCYTFAVSGDRYSGFVGPMNGLSLTLYVADSEYLARHSQGSGFKVEIHPLEYVPFPEDKGFTVSPGVMTSVGMKQMRISRMPLPYDGTDCGDLSKTSNSNRYYNALAAAGLSNIQLNYTTQACIKSCFQRQLITSINNSTTGRVCEHECPQSCHEQGYTTRITSALWPRTSYYNRVRDLWQNQVPSMASFKQAQEARTNLLRLEVYYEELNYESVVESPSQDVWDLLSTIGGTLGLYVGLSFLTLGEFIELLLKCVALPAQHKLQHLGLSVDDL